MALKKLPLALAGVVLTLILVPLLLPRTRTSPSSLPIPTVRAPIFSEISPRPEENHPAWIELYNPGSGPADLEGLELRTLGSQRYPLGDRFDTLPGGEWLVVCFDLDPGNREMEPCPRADHVEHAPAAFTTAWQPQKAQIVLVDLSPGGGADGREIDTLAWGAPPDRLDDDPIRPTGSGLHDWVLLEESTGLYDPDAELDVGGAIGLIPGGRPGNPRDWVVLTADEASPGNENRRAAPRFVSPPSGSTVRHADAVIGWLPMPGDTEYRIQLTSSGNFDRPEHDISWNPDEGPFFRPIDRGVGYGTFDYRICRQDCSTDVPFWSWTMTITLSRMVELGNVVSQIEGITYEFQRKDTPMLCLDPKSGAVPSYDQGCGENHWDRPHPPPREFSRIPTQICDWSVGVSWPKAAASWGQHGRNYCVPASIKMIVSSYNKCLSQDRIAYKSTMMELLEAGIVDSNPDEDLMHTGAVGHCDGPSGGPCTKLLQWALGTSATVVPGPISVSNLSTTGPVPDLIFTPSPPSFDVIEIALNGGRPIMSRWDDGTSSPHVRVIVGSFRSSPAKRYLRILDPLNGPRWVLFVDSDWSSYSKGTWACPPSGFKGNVLNDEAGIWLDDDHDGIVDFDETKRFDTSTGDPDSDGDLIADKADLREYVFLPTPLPFLPSGSSSFADFDGDGSRKEVDFDNDGDLCLDGWEDTNLNGRRDPGENWNFDHTDCEPFLPGCP